MENITIDGIGSIQGGSYGRIMIDGVGTIKGDCSCEFLGIDGVFKAEGSVNAGELECDGIATIQGNLECKRITVEGLFKVTGGRKMTAENIRCDGIISAEGEISADRITADGYISADEITGDEIIIKSCSGWFSWFTHKRSRIKMIEATRVELRGVTADSVNGEDLRIDRGCRIKNVDCSGTLWISPRARIENITGNYTRV